MTVVVNTLGLNCADIKRLIAETFTRIVKNHPPHIFFFLADSDASQWLPAAGNVVIKIIAYEAKPALWKKWWQTYQLPKLLIKLKAAVLVNTSGEYWPKTAIPQLLLLDDNAVAVAASAKQQKLLLAMMDKASIAVLNSNSSLERITKLSAASAQKMKLVLVPAQTNFVAINWQEKELIKEQYTGGKEYFLYCGPITPDQNIVNLLKAFSLFKKRQLSNMQLVLAGQVQWPGKGFEEKLSSYKYRADVRLLSKATNEILPNVIAAAYAFLNPVEKPGFNATQLAAMCSGVPVLTSSNEAEPGAAAVLYAAADKPEKMAEQMKMIYKDEHLRNQLIIAGTNEAEKYRADTSAANFWECIAQAITIH